MSTPEARKTYEENMMFTVEERGVSFGWSSPWPLMETDYSIKLLEENRAIVLYYARTSDPHVTVWAEVLNFEIKEDFETEDDFKIINSEIIFLDSINNVTKFVLAYEGGINNTPMDYLTNGLGEVLNQNAKEHKDSVWYKELFSPETAVVSLLNLDSENVYIDVGEGNAEGEVILVLHFKEEEKESVLQGIKMIQPFGKDGIWIPQNYADSILMEDGEKYFNYYEFYKEDVGENFLEEYYEKTYMVESDISRDGLDENIEVYRVVGKDEIQILAKDSFSFNIEGQMLDEDKKQELQEFMDTLYLYLEQSKLLLSTQEGELKAIGLSEEELTLEDITSEWYLWKK